MKDAPIAIPIRIEMLMRMPARHSRARKKHMTGNASRYQAQWIHVEAAIKAIMNMSKKNGVFLLRSLGHKKHIMRTTDMVKIYGRPRNKRFIRAGFITVMVSNAIGHASGLFKNNIATRENSINKVITEKLTK